MISNLRGVTLIEIVVAIFIIVLFSTIIISDFPKMQRQSALSRVAYKIAQDLRRAEDLGLSGVLTKDINGALIAAKGYGIYIYISPVPSIYATKYLIYADISDGMDGMANRKYDGTFDTDYCVDQVSPAEDCVIEIIDLIQQNPSLYIKQINNISNNNGYYTSINFSPPGPTTSIANLITGQTAVEIVFGLITDSSAIRKVLVNTSGLINVQ